MRDRAILVNSGGTIFTTLFSTLTAVQDSRLTTLAHEWADGKITPIDADGNLYIERDPPVFAYVLTYLRNQCQVVSMPDYSLLGNVLLFADFYCMTDLTTAIAEFAVNSDNGDHVWACLQAGMSLESLKFCNLKPALLFAVPSTFNANGMELRDLIDAGYRYSQLAGLYVRLSDYGVYKTKFDELLKSRTHVGVIEPYQQCLDQGEFEERYLLFHTMETIRSWQYAALELEEGQDDRLRRVTITAVLHAGDVSCATQSDPERPTRDQITRGYSMDPSFLTVIPDPRSGGLERSAAYLDEIQARERYREYNPQYYEPSGTMAAQTRL